MRSWTQSLRWQRTVKGQQEKKSRRRATKRSRVSRVSALCPAAYPPAARLRWLGIAPSSDIG